MKYKLLFELVSQKETEHWCISISESVNLINDLSKVAKKHKFDWFVKWYPKEKLNYTPTKKEYNIKTIEDITELSEQQFEFFIDDLRNYCNMIREVNNINKIMPWVIKHEQKWMTWLDTWLNESLINLEVSNRIWEK